MPERHPSALGATWNEGKLIPITRHGRVENIWWTYSYSPIDDESVAGGVGGVLVICKDVTAQQNATEELKRERERLIGLSKQAAESGTLPVQRRGLSIANFI